MIKSQKEIKKILDKRKDLKQWLKEEKCTCKHSLYQHDLNMFSEDGEFNYLECKKGCTDNCVYWQIINNV